MLTPGKGHFREHSGVKGKLFLAPMVGSMRLEHNTAHTLMAGAGSSLAFRLHFLTAVLSPLIPPPPRPQLANLALSLPRSLPKVKRFLPLPEQIPTIRVWFPSGRGFSGRWGQIVLSCASQDVESIGSSILL